MENGVKIMSKWNADTKEKLRSAYYKKKKKCTGKHEDIKLGKKKIK